MDIFQVIDNLPEGVAKVSLFVGNERQQLDQVYTFEHLADVQEIQDKLRTEGFGSEFKHARVIFRDEKGKQLKSCSIRKAIPIQSNALTPAFKELVAGYLNMQRNYERVFDMFSRAADDNAKREKKLRDELLELQNDLMEAKIKAAALDVKAMEVDESEGHKWNRVAEVVESLGSAYLFGKQDRLSPEGFLMEASNNPSFLEALMTDKRVSEFIQAKLLRPKPIVEDVVEDVVETVVEPKEDTQ